MERSPQVEGGAYEKQVAPSQLPKRLDESAAQIREVATLAGTTEASAEPLAERDGTDDDDFPWDDAARWRPGGIDDGHLAERQLDSEALDELFGEPQGDVIG